MSKLDTAAGGSGNWSGTATIKNTASEARAGDFVFTLTRGGTKVATLSGSTEPVPGGGTATVALTSDERYTSGAYDYTFEAAFGF